MFLYFNKNVTPNLLVLNASGRDWGKVRWIVWENSRLLIDAISS